MAAVLVPAVARARAGPDAEFVFDPNTALRE